MRGPAASGPTGFTPAVRSARSVPSDKGTGCCLSCRGAAVRNNPAGDFGCRGFERGGGWRWMLTYIHRQHAATGAAVFEQSAMKIPEKILAAT